MQVLFEMLQGVTVLIGAVVAMAWLDWRLMLIVLTFIPATVGIVIGYQRLSAHAVMRSRELRSDINAQDGAKHRRYERATGNRFRPTLRRAVCEHQSRALQGTVG